MIQTGHQIELFISCRNLKDKDTFTKSDPCVLIYIKPFINDQIQNQWRLVGKTETQLNNLNPNFKQTFILDYIFEVRQPIRFEVQDVDGQNHDDLGFAESTIGELFGARNQTYIHDLGKGSKLITRCDVVHVTNDYLSFKWKATRLTSVNCCGKANARLRMYRVKASDFLVVETEVIGSCENPEWKAIVQPSTKFGDVIKVEVMDRETVLGTAVIQMSEIHQGRKDFPIGNSTLHLLNFQVVHKPDFMDYIKWGTQLQLTIAVDFTGSNGDPSQPSSLHYKGDGNQYLHAITSVGEILLAYDYDRKVPCYGFGAQCRYPTLHSDNTLHCFPMSGNVDDTEASGLDGIQNIYLHALNNVQLSGPTLFYPLIKETKKLATELKKSGKNAYMILMIMTDGEINDMGQTQEVIFECANLPLSIIIIGIGNSNFKMMEQLDGDGIQTTRDIVQFVPYRKFPNSMLLAKEVLHELPGQLVQYMDKQHIYPEQNNKIDLDVPPPY